MKPAAKWWKRIAIACGLLLAVGIGIRAWVVPSVLASQLESRLHGRARFDRWWLGGSAGLGGFVARDGFDADSPVWLEAGRVETDLSLGGLLRLHFAPSRVVIDRPILKLRFDRKGQILTKGPFGRPATDTNAGAIPAIEIRDATVTVEQEGRPPLTLTRITGTFGPEGADHSLHFASDDPAWGRWTAEGRLEADLKAGTIRVASPRGFLADHEKTARVPFVPPEVWSNIDPTGPVDVDLTLELRRDSAHPFEVGTSIELRGTTAKFPGLGIETEGTTGHVEILDGVVRLERMAGRSLDGTISGTGTLDFRGPAPWIDIALKLETIDVSRAPKSWKLEALGATGRLTGDARLLIAVTKDGPDLTGSVGEAEIKGATLQGFTIKSLRFAMRAKGSDIEYETKDTPQPSASAPRSSLFAERLALLLVAFQDPAKEVGPRFKLPKSLSTQIEVEDIDLARLVDRLEALTKIRIPVPLAGHLALKADAKIPLGTLADLKGYTIRGNATLSGASINGIDLGHIAARFALDGGVLSLDDLDGQLADRPDGDAASPPEATRGLAVDATRRAGSFRGSLRAELSPAGRLEAHIDGHEVPIGELVAPYFPRPTPVSGKLTAVVSATSEVAKLGEAGVWSAEGQVEGRSMSYRGSALDSAASSISLKAGKLELPDFAITLAGRPLKGRLSLDLAGPRPFSGEVDVEGWSIESVVALLPDAPHPAPAAGELRGHVAVRGTLSPLAIETDGKAVIEGAKVDSIPIGDASASWRTERNAIEIKEFQARPFSGLVSGEASIPLGSMEPIRARATFSSIDTARLVATVAKGKVSLVGVAKGWVSATIPRDLRGMTAEAAFEAPELVVQGVKTGRVAAMLRDRGDHLDYELSADGPEGKVRFKGEVPTTGRAEARYASAKLQAAGFTIAEIWNLLGMKGTAPALAGRAAIEANVRAPVANLEGIGVHGVVEVRDLRWGQSYPLGNLRGILARTSETWRLDSLRGDLVGGSASGVAWSVTPAEGPAPINFELQTDRASLPKLFAFAPAIERQIQGFGTIRLNGRMEGSLRATADISVAHATLSGLSISELRLPAELLLQPGGGAGTIHARNFTSRVCGGRVQGGASLRLGNDRSFSVDLGLTDIDLESLSRYGRGTTRTGSGKLNGRINLAGHDPGHPEGYRGRILLNLNDAAIGNVPVIRELGKFLGSAQGSVFESGNLEATVGNRRISVDQLTLAGRVIQIHATGTVGFGGQLDLTVLVNTTQIIPESGQALLAAIPGLREVLGRSEEAFTRLTSFLSSRLLKFRVGGTLKSPAISVDAGVAVTEAATGFFAGILRLPIGLRR